jgi:hypothetical protein
MDAKGPKHRVLTEEETFNTFCSWQSRMKTVLRKDNNYTRFLIDNGPDTTWKKVSDQDAGRGLKDDTDGDKVKKEVKLLHLNGMLEEIAQWAPHYIAHEIIAESTSIESVWDTIRSYYQFQQNEIQFMTLLKIQWEGPDKERPEHLYRRIMAHIHDNLLKKGGKLQYNNMKLPKNEEITPTVERLAILHWLQLIDIRLPQLVVKTFSNELQTMTLKDIQPQISSSIDSFLEELKQNDAQASFLKLSEEVQASRVYSKFQRPPPKPFQRTVNSNPFQRTVNSNPGKMHMSSKLTCRLCRAEGRQYSGHTLATCGYIGRAEKRDMIKAFNVHSTCDDEVDQCDSEANIQDLVIDDE